MKSYPFNMIKEIEESPRIMEEILSRYMKDGKVSFDPKLIKVIKKSDNIIFLACGTSYHASMVGVYLARKLGKISDAFIASEWAYNPIIYGKKPVFILVSQSGETADILACKKYLKGDIVSITNVRNSSIDKLAKWCLPLDCGEEKAIAATKSYVAQVEMIAMLMESVKGNPNIYCEVMDCKRAVEDIIKRQNQLADLAKYFVNAKNAFFLGRGIDHFAAMEGSLKLKETCYIHSEAYPGGELKHGPIALIEKGVPVVGLISDDTTNKLFRNNLQDIYSKGADLIIISSKHLSLESDSFVTEDVCYYLETIVKVVCEQLIAYNTSKDKGLNVDNPRSLVKAVVVE